MKRPVFPFVVISRSALGYESQCGFHMREAAVEEYEALVDDLYVTYAELRDISDKEGGAVVLMKWEKVA